AHEVSEGKATAFVLWNVFGALLAGGFGLALTAGARPEMVPVGLVIGVMLYLVALGFGWVWMVFNSITGLRNRVRQAQSLIDVQLKRRADLIPPLVACVQGFRAHEASVQTLVAALRAQAAGARTAALAPLLVAVTERYPEIRAQESFDELRKNLVETEDRIALARAYHANIATWLRTPGPEDRLLIRLPRRRGRGAASRADGPTRSHPRGNRSAATRRQSACGLPGAR
ncbi:MAG: LemA family protein, partial [Verrucomicrobia bacterium]|nr:LemA family protein [Verrucomicrobiota bacterium]